MSSDVFSSRRLAGNLLSLPALLIVSCAVFMPAAIVIFSAVTQNGHFTLDALQQVLSRPQYLLALWTTAKISFLVSCLCITVALPACLFCASQGATARKVFFAVLIFSFSISALIRVISWQLILSNGGPIDVIGRMLFSGEFTSGLLYTEAAVLVATTHIMLPYAASIMFTAIVKVEQEYVTAATSLGAPPMTAFFQAYWPQIRPGVVNAFLLVFVLTTGSFITPALLGGPDQMMLGNTMHSDLTYDFENGVRLASASGIALSLLLAVACIVAIPLAGRPYYRRGDNA